MGSFLLALLLLAPVPITAAGRERPTRQLAGRSEVQRLCRALEFPERRRDASLDRASAEAEQQERRARALELRYAVELAGRGLSFHYDAERGALTLDARAQLVGAGGALRLWAVADAELALPADPALARRIAAAARSGEGRLRLHFVLPEDDDEAVCAHAPGTLSFGLGVEPVSWAFVVKDEVLSRGGADEVPAAPASEGPGRPKVEVGTPSGRNGEAVRQALLRREEALLGCYRRRLEQQPGSDGSLVLELVPRSGGGRPGSARVAMDSLHAPELSRCVLQAVEGVELPAGKEAAPVQVPLHFRQEGR